MMIDDDSGVANDVDDWWLLTSHDGWVVMVRMMIDNDWQWSTCQGPG